jgi:hypothetical protein
MMGARMLPLLETTMTKLILPAFVAAGTFAYGMTGMTAVWLVTVSTLLNPFITITGIK